ncbi:MAG TPA: hypothetical protein VGH87_10130 [Polyangiaceae bacterium]
MHSSPPSKVNLPSPTIASQAAQQAIKAKTATRRTAIPWCMVRVACVKLGRMCASLSRGLFAAVLFAAPAAWAGGSAADVATARSLGMEGLRLAQSGKCAEAIEKLKRAEQLFHAPTTLEGLGECEIAVGRIVDGTEDLRRVTLEHLGPRAPAVFRAAQSDARAALARALPRIAKVRIDVVGVAPADASVTVDGEIVPSAAIGVERPFDPGAHTIAATAAGYKPFTTHAQIAEGGTQTVTLTLERAPEATPIVHEHHTVTKRSYAPAGIAFGLAGGTAIAGAIFGSIVIVRTNDLAASCPGNVCPSTLQGSWNEIGTFATISTVTFVVAGVAAVAGIVLVALAPRHTIETVSMRASPSGLWLEGTF